MQRVTFISVACFKIKAESEDVMRSAMFWSETCRRDFRGGRINYTFSVCMWTASRCVSHSQMFQILQENCRNHLKSSLFQRLQPTKKMRARVDGLAFIFSSSVS